MAPKTAKTAAAPAKDTKKADAKVIDAAAIAEPRVRSRKLLSSLQLCFVSSFVCLVTSRFDFVFILQSLLNLELN